MPEMIEKILRSAADTAVVIRGAEHNDIGSIDPRLEGRITFEIMRDLRIIQGQRFLTKIQQVYGAAGSGQPLRYEADNYAGNGCLLQTADNC